MFYVMLTLEFANIYLIFFPERIHVVYSCNHDFFLNTSRKTLNLKTI